MTVYSYEYVTHERLATEFRNGESLADFVLDCINAAGATGRRVVDIAKFERPSGKFIAGDPISSYNIMLIVESETRKDDD